MSLISWSNRWKWFWFQSQAKKKRKNSEGAALWREAKETYHEVSRRVCILGSSDGDGISSVFDLLQWTLHGGHFVYIYMKSRKRDIHILRWLWRPSKKEIKELDWLFWSKRYRYGAIPSSSGMRRSRSFGEEGTNVITDGNVLGQLPIRNSHAHARLACSNWCQWMSRMLICM